MPYVKVIHHDNVLSTLSILSNHTSISLSHSMDQKWDPSQDLLCKFLGSIVYHHYLRSHLLGSHLEWHGSALSSPHTMIFIHAPQDSPLSITFYKDPHFIYAPWQGLLSSMPREVLMYLSPREAGFVSLIFHRVDRYHLYVSGGEPFTFHLYHLGDDSIPRDTRYILTLEGVDSLPQGIHPTFILQFIPSSRCTCLQGPDCLLEVFVLDVHPTFILQFIPHDLRINWSFCFLYTKDVITLLIKYLFSYIFSSHLSWSHGRCK